MFARNNEDDGSLDVREGSIQSKRRKTKGTVRQRRVPKDLFMVWIHLMIPARQRPPRHPRKLSLISRLLVNGAKRDFFSDITCREP